ncbi:MAG: hypothetical protein K0S16_186 [Moraxellaceae bacterium]|jgi:hypothetical protein|nr:hypothetical protein [Moraxellaceae bacterium]
MTLYCRYHVLEQAQWRCSNCGIDYCTICSPESLEEDVQLPHKCPHCKAILQPLGGAHSAAPFWQRLTSFLRYPLSPMGIAIMAVGLVLPLFVPQGVLMYMVQLGFLVGITLYLWSVFEATAGGKLDPIGPRAVAATLAKDTAPLFVGILLAVMAGGVGFLASDPKTAFGGKMLALVLVGLLPAMLIAVGRTRSVTNAVSKEGIMAVLSGIGPVYTAVFLLPVLLLVGLHSFVSLFADVLPDAIGQGMYMAGYTYLLVAIFALSGHVLFQYQDSLNFNAEGEGSKRKSYKRIDPVQLQIEMSLKDGNYGKAVQLLKTDVERKSATLTQHERYHKLLWTLGQQEALREHLTPFFKALLQNGRGIQAASIFKAMIQRWPDMKLPDPETRLDFAVALDEQGDYKLAVHVLNGLHREHAQFPAMPDAYLLAARILDEQLAMPQKAYALVEFLHGRYRNHRKYPEITKTYNALAQKLGVAQQ